MPNWCENTLTVTGPKEHLDKFKELSIKDDVFTLSGVYPTPEELLNIVSPNYYRGEDEQEKIEHDKKVQMLINKYGHEDWYNWRIANWGTKWDASDMQGISINEDEQLSLWFASAWSPPLGWVKVASERFTCLNFVITYMEEGVGFCGRFSVIDGFENIEDVEIEYQDDDGNTVIREGDNWINAETKAVVAYEEDFWPRAVNPLED